MRLYHTLTAAMIILLSPLSKAAAAAEQAPGPVTISADSGFIIPVELNGRPLRLRVDPAIGGIVLNPEAAASTGLKPSILSSLFGPTLLVGPVRLDGRSGSGLLRIGAWKGKRDVLWFERDVVSGADGAIGMADLPNESVTLQLRSPRAADGRYEYQTTGDGVLGLIYRHSVGGADVTTRFSLLQPITQVSASAGALLADHHGGVWAGEPSRKLITFGVERPVRPMRFSRPVSLNGMMFDHLVIRTGDYRGNYVLPTDPAADPNEIVVTGSKGSGKAILRLTVGNDRLGTCSSISYSRSAKRLTLTCPSG